MNDATSLGAYLKGLDQRGRDAVAEANGVVDGLDARTLTEALSRPTSIMTALRGLDSFALDLLEGMLAVTAGSASATDVERLVDGRATPAQVSAAVDRLAAAALAWPVGAAVRPSRRVLQVLDRPAGLGLPAAELLADCTVAQLSGILRAGKLPSGAGKARLVQQVTALLQDETRTYDVLSSAPPAALAAIRRLHDARGAQPMWSMAAAADPLRWFMDFGLVIFDQASYSAELPREVGLALRGGRVLPDLSAEPPGTPYPVGAAAEPTAGSGEIATLLGDAAAILQAVDARAVPTLKAGGLGVRELRRLATALTLSEARTRLVVAVLVVAGLLDASGPELLPTADADEWLDEPPALRWLRLFAGWLAAGAWLGDPEATLGAPTDRLPGSVLPVHVLQTLAALPAGWGLAAEDLPGQLHWRHPLEVSTGPELAEQCGRLLAEGAALGMVVAGALTPAVRALWAGGSEEALAMLAPALPAAESRALVGSDLTVVVPGPPAPALARLLDAVGTRESRGAGASWRLTPASVRSAFDEGMTSVGILDGLRQAAGRDLPPVVEQLVADVARRHGEIEVSAAGCVLTTGDPVLAARLAADRSLKALKLRDHGGGVLGAPGAPAVVLAALRAAGYLPRAEQPEPSRASQRRRAPVQVMPEDWGECDCPDCLAERDDWLEGL